MALLEGHAKLYGYYDGKIVIKESDDYESLYADGATLTAHAPLWGTKEGQEKAYSILEVRNQLNKTLKFGRVDRVGMQIATKNNGVCLFFTVLASLRFLPCVKLMRVPLIFVVDFCEEKGELKIKEINEWPAKTPQEGLELLTGQLGWPAETKFEPRVLFGALN